MSRVFPVDESPPAPTASSVASLAFAGSSLVAVSNFWAVRSVVPFVAGAWGALPCGKSSAREAPARAKQQRALWTGTAIEAKRCMGLFLGLRGDTDKRAPSS